MSANPLPRWDLTPFFPALDAPQVREALHRLREDFTTLGDLFDRYGVRRKETRQAPVPEFEEVTARLNGVLQQFLTLRSYLNCHVTTEAANDLAQALASELRSAQVKGEQLSLRYTAWVGSMDTEALLAASPVARAHEFAVRKAALLVQHQMSEAQEDLASELAPPGLYGWERLHGEVTALLTVPFARPGAREPELLPMSAVRSLANDPDRAVRKAAYEAELAAWKQVEVPLAAALNGIKGFQQVIRTRRHFEDDIAPSLLANSVDRQTLEAMQTAVAESFPDFRRYLRAKARALGLERLAWYDLQAPVSSVTRRFTWPEAEEFILTQFGRYSRDLAALAERGFREGWHDAEPRPGKEGGAYCTGIAPGVSRLFMNFDGSFNSVSTLAHELGHAYHNYCLRDRLPLQRRTPSTLAETASIFCETLSFDAAMQEASGPERLALLETSLERDLMVVVDIHSRFLFERSVFEARARRELSAAELCSRMLEAQEATYGDGLDPDARHPYMWAVKGHYYGPTFYNYPYTFGLLFGLGLYQRYREHPQGFHQAYDALLADTGMADAAELATRFGIDVRRPDFWRSSLDGIRANLSEFERLTADDGSR